MLIMTAAAMKAVTENNVGVKVVSIAEDTASPTI